MSPSNFNSHNLLFKDYNLKSPSVIANRVTASMTASAAALENLEDESMQALYKSRQRKVNE